MDVEPGQDLWRVASDKVSVDNAMPAAYCERTWKRFVSYMEKAEPGILFVVHERDPDSEYVVGQVQSKNLASRRFRLVIEDGYLCFHTRDPETRIPFEVTRVGVPKRAWGSVAALRKEFYHALDLCLVAQDERKKALATVARTKVLYGTFAAVRDLHKDLTARVMLPAPNEAWNYDLETLKSKVGLRLPDVWMDAGDLNEFFKLWRDFTARLTRPNETDFLDGLQDEGELPGF